MPEPGDVVRLEAFRGAKQKGAPPIRERVVARLKLLKRWRVDGVPSDYIARLPASLEQARAWEAPEFGIVPIGSKSDFVRTHPDWGGEVRDIDGLLKALAGMYRPPRGKKSIRRQAAEAAERAEKVSITLERVTRQWHAARDEVKGESLKRVASEARYAELLEQNSALLEKLAHQEEELRFVRRQLANLRG